MSMSRFDTYVTCVLVSAAALGAAALDNGLGRTPAMGYNSWYDFYGSIDEATIKASIDAFVNLGFPQLGYSYFNMDDFWAGGRYANGSIYADPAKFPSKSLRPLADYCHERGLKFGLYTDRGSKTCGGTPGSLGYEAIDATTYAEWGADYLKEDSCYASTDHAKAFAQYGRMRDALNATGRPILFSLCGWNSWYAPVGATLGNSWRIGPDNTNWDSVLVNININSALSQYAGPGGFNDPCLLLSKDHDNELEVTELQTRAQFSMWAVMASPLLISGNVRNMSTSVVETYSNEAVIAINQDALGRQGVRAAGGNLTVNGAPGDSTNVWIRSLTDGFAVMFLNVGDVPASIECDGQCFDRGGVTMGSVLCGMEVWTEETFEVRAAQGMTVIDVAPHGGHALYKMSREACRDREDQENGTKAILRISYS